MTAKHTSEGLRAARRAKLAELWLKAGRDEGEGTEAALLAALARVGFDISVGTLKRDKTWLKDEWNRTAILDRDTQASGMLVELRQARRLAWSQEKPDSIGNLLDREAKLLALYPADRREAEQSITLEQFVNFLQRQAVVIRRYVPAEDLLALERALDDIPFLPPGSRTHDVG